MWSLSCIALQHCTLSPYQASSASSIWTASVLPSSWSWCQSLSWIMKSQCALILSRASRMICLYGLPSQNGGSMRNFDCLQGITNFIAFSCVKRDCLHQQKIEKQPEYSQFILDQFIIAEMVHMNLLVYSFALIILSLQNFIAIEEDFKQFEVRVLDCSLLFLLISIKVPLLTLSLTPFIFLIPFLPGLVEFIQLWTLIWLPIRAQAGQLLPPQQLLPPFLNFSLSLIYSQICFHLEVVPQRILIFHFEV